MNSISRLPLLRLLPLRSASRMASAVFVSSVCAAPLASPAQLPAGVEASTVSRPREVLDQIIERDRKTVSLAKARGVLDVTPPVLQHLSVAARVDVSQPGAALPVKLRASDDLVGVSFGMVTVRSPSGQWLYSYFGEPTPQRKLSRRLDVGNDLSPSLGYDFTSYSEPGTWTVESVYLSDANGNARQYDTNELASLGDIHFEVVNSVGFDAVAPTLLGGDIRPASVKASETPPGAWPGTAPMVSAVLELRDDGNVRIAGIRTASIVLCLLEPDGRCGGDSTFVSGSQWKAGVVRTRVELGGRIRPDQTPGTYGVSVVYGEDWAGNSFYLQGIASGGDIDFGQLFRRATFEVVTQAGSRPGRDATVHGTSPLDVAPPQLALFNISTSTVDARQADAAINSRIEASDDLTGFSYVYVHARSPSGQTVERGESMSAPGRGLKAEMTMGLPRVSFMRTISKYSEPGAWWVDWVYLSDVNGNSRSYYTDELALLGNNSFTVANPTGHDARPPTLIGGWIRTPRVSLAESPRGSAPGTPGYLSVGLELKDVGNGMVSGVRSANLGFCLVDPVEACRAMLSTFAEFSSEGIAGGLLSTGNQLAGDQTPGRYELSSITLTDWAGNAVTLASVKSGGSTDFSKLFPTTHINVVP